MSGIYIIGFYFIGIYYSCIDKYIIGISLQGSTRLPQLNQHEFIFMWYLKIEQEFFTRFKTQGNSRVL